MMYFLSSSSFPLASWGGNAGLQKELGKLDYIMVLKIFFFCQIEFYQSLVEKKIKISIYHDLFPA